MREGGRGGGGGLVHGRWGFDSEYVGLGGGSPLMQNGLGSGAGGDCGEEHGGGEVSAVRSVILKSLPEVSTAEI